MKRLLLLLPLIFTLRATAQEVAMPPYQIVAYYASWNLYTAQPFLLTDVPGDRLTQLVYAFAVISEAGECTYADEWADAQAPYPEDNPAKVVKGHFGQIAALRERFPHLKVTLAIGGWTGSGRFSDVALTPESRARFVESCVAFMRRYDFDGLDIDWEYPVAEGAPGNSRRPADKANLTLLLTDFRTALDDAARTDERPYSLSIAAPTSPSLWQHFEWAQIAPLLDHIFLMAYDMAGSWSPVTASHAPLYADPASPVTPPLSADLAVQGYLALGVPPEKLILGVPFYGKAWAGAEPDADGLYQSYDGLPNAEGSFTYRQLAADYLIDGGAVRHWSPAGQFPWLYRPGDGLFITYDDAESLALKAAYVRAQGLGGAGLWEISQDDAAHTLLNVLWAGLPMGG
jgi:chitinase